MLSLMAVSHRSHLVGLASPQMSTPIAARMSVCAGTCIFDSCGDINLV